MSDKLPKLKTKYENDDPDFSAPQSSSENAERRTQPKRNIQNSPKDVLEISDSDESFKSSNNSALSDSIDSPKASLSEDTTDYYIFHFPFKGEEIENESINISKFILVNPTNTMDPDGIKAIVTAVVQSLATSQNQAPAPRQPTPKLDIPKLTMHNYVDWSKKMSYALKFHNLWVDPTREIDSLDDAEQEKNSKAVLYMACHLDDQNSSFVNASNEKCFISAWNLIKKFHQPRTATVLTDIHSRIQELKHQSGQSIEAHLMKLDAQFARFQEAGDPLKESHLVALILSSVRNSPDFASVFHSAMWEDEDKLTIAKVKSVLISTSRRQRPNGEEQAHRAKFPQAKQKSRIQHKRQPRDRVKGWACPQCEMDNHKSEDCNRNKSRSKLPPTKQSHHVEDDDRSDSGEHAHVAHAYATGPAVFKSHHISPRASPCQQFNQTTVTDVKSRLGNPVKKSPYQNVFPRQTQSWNESVYDILDIGFNRDFDDDVTDYDDVPIQGSNEESHLLDGKTKDTIIKNTSNFFHLIHQNNFNKRIKQSRKLAFHELSHEPMFSQEIKCDNEILPESNFKCMKYLPTLSFKATANCINHNPTINNLNSKFTTWIIDSGATLHMCNSSNIL